MHTLELCQTRRRAQGGCRMVRGGAKWKERREEREAAVWEEWRVDFLTLEALAADAGSWQAGRCQKICCWRVWIGMSWQGGRTGGTWYSLVWVNGSDQIARNDVGECLQKHMPWTQLQSTHTAWWGRAADPGLLRRVEYSIIHSVQTLHECGSTLANKPGHCPSGGLQLN